MILYRIIITQHLDTDTVYQLYRTSLNKIWIGIYIPRLN